MPDTSRTIAIAGSPWKIWGLFLLALLMTVASLTIAVPLIPLGARELLGRIFGTIGVLFFGFCTVMILWRAITSLGPVVTLSPDGIRDVRLASQSIPWPAIRSISTWEYQGQSFVVLDVDPEVESQLQLSAITRMTRGANRALGVDGLCVGAQELAISFDVLHRMAVTYAEAHNGRGGERALHPTTPSDHGA